MRDRTKVATSHASLRVVDGDVFSANSLEPHFQQQDVVISALGFPRVAGITSTYFTRSCAAIIDAMKAARLRRIVTISAWYTDPVSRVGQPMYDNMWAKIPGLPETLDNEGLMERMLVDTSADVDYTSVRAPTLTWDADSKKHFIEEEEGHWVTGGSAFISREDVARFMLTTAEQPGPYRNKCVAIAVKYSDAELVCVRDRFRAHLARARDTTK